MGIDKKDIAILRVLDGLRASFEFVYTTKVAEKLPYDEDFVTKRLFKLNKLKLVQLRNFEQEIGCRILQKGLDILSIWNFKKHGVIKDILTQIGAGKESTVFSAISPDNEFLVLKFHRYYALEFKKIKRSLAYASVKLRGEEIKKEEYMIDIPRAKAQVEFKVMKELYSKGFSVPRPVDLDRHVVVMEMVYDEPGIPAPLLKDVNLSNPKEAKEAIIEEYLDIVEQGGFVHGDFNEFNVMIKKNGEFFIIDWPQAVPTSYELADKLKKRDLENIKRYFLKKYGV